MFPSNDDQWTEWTIERVEGDRKHGWTVTFDGCICFGIPGDSPVVPRVGMTMRQYGRGFGYRVRGCFIDGQKVFYRTLSEQDQHDAKELAESEQRRRDDFEKSRASMDARYEALPPIFRARLDKFRRNNPDFRWQFEDYELFCCEQAVLISSLGTADAISEFHAKPWADQLKAVAGLSDDHSGNTFGCACQLAIDYLENPEHVEARHGALAPLVGSEEYGCVPRKTVGDLLEGARDANQ